MNVKLLDVLNSENIGKLTYLLNECLFKIVVIIRGSHTILSSVVIYSGLIKDDDAPVSIKNLKGLPKGEEIFMNGKSLPCLFISKNPVCPRPIRKNPGSHQCCLTLDFRNFHIHMIDLESFGHYLHCNNYPYCWF